MKVQNSVAAQNNAPQRNWKSKEWLQQTGNLTPSGEKASNGFSKRTFWEKMTPSTELEEASLAS